MLRAMWRWRGSYISFTHAHGARLAHTHTLLSPLTQSLISSDTCKGQSCPLAFGHDTPVATSKPSGEGRVGDGGGGRLTAQNGGIKPIAAFCLPHDSERITIEQMGSKCGQRHPSHGRSICWTVLYIVTGDNSGVYTVTLTVLFYCRGNIREYWRALPLTFGWASEQTVLCYSALRGSCLLI